MRRNAVLWCAGLLAAVPGCNIAYYSAKNLVNEPLQTANQVKLRHRFRQAAAEAWDRERAQDRAFSAAYADGFVDGFADHLEDGGPPRPPALPPPRYRRHASDFTAAGQADQRDYLTGFKHGADAAAASGCRESVYVQIYLPDPRPESPLNIRCVPGPPADRPPPMPPPPPVPDGLGLAPLPRPGGRGQPPPPPRLPLPALPPERPELRPPAGAVPLPNRPPPGGEGPGGPP